MKAKFRLTHVTIQIEDQALQNAEQPQRVWTDQAVWGVLKAPVTDGRKSRFRCKRPRARPSSQSQAAKP